MSTISIIGLDIAKASFSVHCTDASGKELKKAELKRGEVLAFFAKLAPCRVGIEACGSAHHWAREIARLGHDVRLIAASRVKSFVLRQKNDAADARAIVMALLHPDTRFVAVKTQGEQAKLMLFKVRDGLVADRTRRLNALRGHFSEFGIVAPAGPKNVFALVDMILNDDPGLNPVMKAALRPMVSNLTNLNEEIAALEKLIRQAHQGDEKAKRLAEVPGIGVITALLMSSSVTAPELFKGGREFAAYLGLVPLQHSTGGKTRLGHITKMGNRDLRRLLVVGAIAILARWKHNSKGGALGDWARKLLATKPFRLVAVALANKMARIAWAIMARGERFEPDHGRETIAAAA
jgi:transposase